ncbi:MFS transporter [Bosea sp. MMO-172]|uniref:MFS transporter n=1 Tax=Bosea sp. MMO-172 TaxID=3127885 RepID=UPI003018CB20
MSNDAATLTAPVDMNFVGEATPEFIRRGTRLFAKVSFALISSGFSAFAILYCLQPALPTVAKDFGVSASESSLAISVATIALAIGLIFTGPLSDALGRKPVLVGSMLSAGVLSILSAFAMDWTGFLVMRGLIGLVLGGITAINMTYLAEEIEPKQVGFAMGLMIGGNSLGGMLSRLVVGVLADYGIWREAVAGLGLMTAIGAVVVWGLLPASRNFEARPLSLSNAIAGFAMHLRDPVLRPLFITGFLIMGSFVAFFNYISFHLMSAPTNLSQAAIGWLSLVYLMSTITSTKVGELTEKFGSGGVLLASLCIAIIGVALSSSTNAALAIAGVCVFICGFFAAHSVVSGWVGRSARRARAQATALYQIFFYLGASVAGVAGGYVWHHADWLGVSLMVSLMLAAGAMLAFGTRR